MKKIILCILVVSLALSLASCGTSSVDVSVTSAEVVESFATSLNVFLKSDLGTANTQVGGNGMLYTFPDREIIRIELDCTFTGVGENLKANSDEHRQEVYNAIKESVTFTVNGEAVDAIWGYWPQKTNKSSAEKITLLYLIPEGEPLENLNLVIDGSKLGDDTYIFEYTNFTRPPGQEVQGSAVSDDTQEDYATGQDDSENPAITHDGESPVVPSNPEAEMSIISSGVSNGILSDKYGMRGTQKKDGVPTMSPPISIMDASEETVCFAIIMRDPDSKPLCGYEWTHWLAANISGDVLTENASIDYAAEMVQGENSFGFTGYGGPTPPDKPHTYIITVYALDTRLDLGDGFSKDALKQAMAGHILAEAVLKAKYDD